jgi:hypothetical protein
MHSTLQFAVRSQKKRCTVPQRYRSARQNPVQNISAGNGPRWRFRARQAAATFSFPMHKYGRSPLFQDGVSGVHEIDTIYKDEGLKRRENSLIFFSAGNKIYARSVHLIS